MKPPTFRTTANGSALPLAEIPVLPFNAFKEAILRGVQEGARLACLFLDGGTRLYAVLADDAEHRLAVGRHRTEVPPNSPR